MTTPSLTTLTRVEVAAMDGERHELTSDMRLWVVKSLTDDARPEPVTLMGAVRAILRREAYWLAYTCEVEAEHEGGEWRPTVGLQGMQYVPLPPAGMLLVHQPGPVAA